MKLAIGVTVFCAVMWMAQAFAIEVPTAAAKNLYTPTPTPVQSRCVTECEPEQRDSWGNVQRRAQCRTHCY